MANERFLTNTGYRNVSSLSGYVPYTGATANTNLGGFDITANEFIGPLLGNASTATIAGKVGHSLSSGTGLSGGPFDGSGAITLSITNTAVTSGSYGSSTSIPSFTVNAQGQLTAAAGNAVIAPAGTLTGNTLASGIVSSSLTSLGILSSLLCSGQIRADNLTTDGTNAWKLGAYSATPPAATGYISVVINGTTYQLLAST